MHSGKLMNFFGDTNFSTLEYEKRINSIDAGTLEIFYKNADLDWIISGSTLYSYFSVTWRKMCKW